MSDAKLSNQQTLEWETRARDWLSAMPKTRDITTDEMDGWIDSPHSSLPEDLKSLPRSHIHQRILFIHHLIRQSYQEMDAVQVEPQPPRFQRTDQWMPVYSWLESLEKNEVVKPNEIIDWLSENPGVRDQLHSKHSRHHLMHYIQRCHFKMLRRRERQRKRMQAMQPPTTSPEVKALNNGVTTAAVPLRCKISSTLLKDNDMSLSKKNEALRRYELLTDLQSQLISLLSNHKQANNSKESVSPPSLMQRSTENANNQLSDGGVKEGNISVMSGGASHCQESSLVSPLDSGSGRKRKRHAAVVTPVGSHCEAAAGAGNGFKLDAGSHGGYAGRHREKWIPSSEDMLSLPLAGSHLVDNFRNLLCGLNGEVTHHGFLHGVPIHQDSVLPRLEALARTSTTNKAVLDNLHKSHQPFPSINFL